MRVKTKSVQLYTFINPFTRTKYNKRSVLKRSLTDLNSESSFILTSCHTKVKEPSLTHYLLIAGGRIVWYMPFQRKLMLWEMKTTSSRIWTQIAVSISYDDIHYSTATEWRHRLDSNKMLEERVWEELQKDSSCCLEQIFEAAPCKTAGIRPLISHHTNYAW